MEWKEVRLGDVCTKIGSGATPSGGKEAYQGGDYHLVRSQNVLDFSFSWDGLANINDQQAKKLNNVELQEGDVLLNITGDSVARACIIPSIVLPARVNQHVAIIRPDAEKLDNHYLLYYLQQQKNALLQIASGGATRKAITKAMIEGFSIPLPNIDDQRRIANILSSLDRKIELNNKINAQLEEMAQTLFKHWFVDFGPFKDGKFVESELGMIPEGWRVGMLGEISSITSGKRPPMKQKECDVLASIPLIGAADIMGYTNDSLYNRPILIIGRVGTHGIVQRWFEKCWPSDNTLVLESISYEFVYQILKNIDYSSINRGSTQPLITQTDVKNTCIVIPKNDVLDEFEDKVSAIMKQYLINQKENQKLASLRDTLLPKLMSGEINLEDYGGE